MSSRRRPRARMLTMVLAGCTALGLGAAAWLAGCAANEPFDPDAVQNMPPQVSLYVSPVDPDAELSQTSYFNRTFYWSGTDRDGWVQEYYVSVREDPAVPAPWDTTTATDTTMSFTPDESGEAEATFLLACRDDRGALSDTVVQTIPMRNFPPIINFESDFEPLHNMQREIVDNGAAAPDTVWWNWGIANFRLFAYDLDGRVTMDDFYRYTLMDGEPDQEWDSDDPAADPEAGWVRVPFSGVDEFRKFEIEIRQARPGYRTLTISVNDEADADTRFTYGWEVREPRGDVIYVYDNSSTLQRTLYRGILDEYLGADNWDTYQFVFEFPDRAFVLLESLRKYDVVLWTDGGSTSNYLETAAAPGGALEQYVTPLDDYTGAPGRLMIISTAVAGTASKIPKGFNQTVMGISGSTVDGRIPAFDAGDRALGREVWLPNITRGLSTVAAVWLKPLEGTGVLYHQEYSSCGETDLSCPSVVGVRWPGRSVEQELAGCVSICLPLEKFVEDEARAALMAILEHELGVVGQ